MVTEATLVHFEGSYVRKNRTQAPCLYPVGFLFLKDVSELWILCSRADFLSVRRLKVGDSMEELSEVSQLYIFGGAFKFLPNTISSKLHSQFADEQEILSGTLAESIENSSFLYLIPQGVCYIQPLLEEVAVSSPTGCRHQSLPCHLNTITHETSKELKTEISSPTARVKVSRNHCTDGRLQVSGDPDLLAAVANCIQSYQKHQVNISHGYDRSPLKTGNKDGNQATRVTPFVCTNDFEVEVSLIFTARSSSFGKGGIREDDHFEYAPLTSGSIEGNQGNCYAVQAAQPRRLNHLLDATNVFEVEVSFRVNFRPPSFKTSGNQLYISHGDDQYLSALTSGSIEQGSFTEVLPSPIRNLDGLLDSQLVEGCPFNDSQSLSENPNHGFSGSQNQGMEILPTLNELPLPAKELGKLLRRRHRVVADYRELSNLPNHGMEILSTLNQDWNEPLPPNNLRVLRQGSSSNGRIDAVGESSSHALRIFQNHEMEILTIRNNALDFAGGLAAISSSNLNEIQQGSHNEEMDIINLENEQRNQPCDLINSVPLGGSDYKALENGQDKNSQSVDVKHQKTHKIEVPEERIREKMSKGMTLEGAAKELNISRSTMKRKLKDYGIVWQSRRRRMQHQDAQNKKHNMVQLDGPNQDTLSDHALFERNVVNQSSWDAILEEPGVPTQCQMDGCRDVGEHLNYAKESRLFDIVHQPNEISNTFVVKATFGEDTVKFNFSLSSSIEQLKEEVGKRLELEIGKFKIKYQDDRELILMTDISDLKDALLHSSEGNVVRLFVESKT